MRRNFFLTSALIGLLVLGGCQLRSGYRAVGYQPIDDQRCSVGTGCPYFRGYRTYVAPYREHVITRPPRVPWWVKEELAKVGMTCLRGVGRHYLGSC